MRKLMLILMVISLGASAQVPVVTVDERSRLEAWLSALVQSLVIERERIDVPSNDPNYALLHELTLPNDAFEFQRHTGSIQIPFGIDVFQEIQVEDIEFRVVDLVSAFDSITDQLDTHFDLLRCVSDHENTADSIVQYSHTWVDRTHPRERHIRAVRIHSSDSDNYKGIAVIVTVKSNPDSQCPHL